MELTTCARPYAKAAFEYALSQNGLDQWSGMLSVCASVAQSEKVIQLLSTPGLTADRQAKAFIGVCGDTLSEAGKNFVGTLAENRRITLLPEVFKLFEVLKAEQQQSISATVSSAYPLTEAQLEKITDKLHKKLGREVRLNSSVDPDLIGGAIIKAGDLVIDGSVRARLEKLADAMLS